MEEEVVKSLMLLGLTRTEVEVYIHLLRCKSFCSALEIAKNSGIHRSNVYDAIYSLNEKGLIKQTTYNKKNIFSAINPENLKQRMTQKQIELDSAVNKLKEFSNSSTEKNIIYSVKGCSNTKKMIKELLLLSKTIKGYGLSKKAFSILGGGFLEDFNRERKEKKIHIQFIYNTEIKNEIKKINSIKKRETKFFEGEIESSTFICGGIILIIIYSSPCTAIKIDNPLLAKSYETYFDFLWNSI